MSRPPSLTLPAGVTAGQLRTARGIFAVLEGRPAPGAGVKGAALLIPGFTGSKEDFLALLAPLARDGWHTVAVDGRGQHESAGPRAEAAYAQAELAADIRAQADALAGGRPVHLVGHSLGGHLARAAVLVDAAEVAAAAGAGLAGAATSARPADAATDADAAAVAMAAPTSRADPVDPAGPDAPAPAGHYTSLTLISSGPAAITPEQQVRTQLAVDFLPTTDMETAWQALRTMDAGGEPGPGGPEDSGAHPQDPAWLEEFLHRRWVNTIPEQLIATARQLMTEPDRVAELAAVALPKLVLSGEVDYAWPVPWLDEMAVRLRARRVVVKGAGHSPNAERPAETAAALAAFWHEASPALPASS
jgi:pimeloyl-ACP methyl ester carboxylesterase